MKKFNKYLTSVLLLMGCVSIGLISCEDDDESLPVVNNIRVIEKDSSIVGGEFGLPVAIQGNHLSSVIEVWFNNVQAELNPAYITNSNILIFIPDEGPTEVNNKITLVTKSGQSVTADFETILPVPVIHQLYNEFAKPGTENYVIGNYFFAITQVLVGEQQVEILDQTPTAIKFVMPDVVGVDHVTVVGGGGTAVSAFRLNETEGNMVNFDIPATYWGSDVCWGDAERINPDQSEIEPVSGRYTRIKQTELPATGYQGNWVVATCWFDFGLEPGPASEKVMRFEAYIGESWKAGYYNINLGTESGETFTYQWKPWDTEQYRSSGIKTNGWATFYIPLENFRKTDVTPAKTIEDVSKIRDLQVMFSNGGDGAAQIPSHYVALDNFRIVNIE